jgi:glycine/D-amino acid oxidase-like deaminating enzyme
MLRAGAFWRLPLSRLSSVTTTRLPRQKTTATALKRALTSQASQFVLPTDAEPSHVVIVGGGIIGSSAAYFLAKRLLLNNNNNNNNNADNNNNNSTTLKNVRRLPQITVVERDSTYHTASTALSASGMRQQFGIVENVAISMFGAQFLRDAASTLHVSPDANGGGGGDVVDVSFREQGYLFLAGTTAGADVLRSNHAMQTSLGADISLLDADALQRRYPWLRTDDVVLASLGGR